MATLSIRSCLTAFVLAATLLLPPSASAQDPVFTSMVQLLAHPKKYHGKRVDVFGYLHVKFEGNAIYLSKTDADYINPKHAFWTQYRQGVTLRASNRKKGASLSEFDCKYVSIQGVFDSTDFGHMGLFAGAIRDISHVSEDTRYYDGKRDLTR
jgi:hypothetical protein